VLYHYVIIIIIIIIIIITTIIILVQMTKIHPAKTTGPQAVKKPPVDGFVGLVVACWPLVPEFAGSNPAEAVRFFCI
jgi:hypothetical protein